MFLPICMCICVCVCVRNACVCVCVRMRAYRVCVRLGARIMYILKLRPGVGDEMRNLISGYVSMLYTKDLGEKFKNKINKSVS